MKTQCPCSAVQILLFTPTGSPSHLDNCYSKCKLTRSWDQNINQCTASFTEKVLLREKTIQKAALNSMVRDTVDLNFDANLLFNDGPEVNSL